MTCAYLGASLDNPAPPSAPLLCAVAPENPVVEVREQAVEGGEVELSCLVPRSRPAAVLRWYRDRKELKGTRGSAWGGGGGMGEPGPGAELVAGVARRASPRF